MDLGLTGKVAVVTGASRGIGRATALSLSEEGCEVVLGSRGAADLARAAREIAAATGNPVHAERVDLADLESLRAFAGRVRRRFPKVDVLVHNVGGAPYKPRSALTEADWRRAGDELFTSARRLAEAFLPGMRSAGGGRILFVLSATARQPGLMLLNAPHAAVLAYAKALAGEVGPDGVLVNCVCPSFVDTGKLREVAEAYARQTASTPDEVMADWMRAVPLGRPATPREVADLIAFLASERAGYLTGGCFDVDGGFLRGLP